VIVGRGVGREAPVSGGRDGDRLHQPGRHSAARADGQHRVIVVVGLLAAHGGRGGPRGDQGGGSLHVL